MLTHIWYWRARMPERKGQPCRVISSGRLNSILVEFADGHRVITSRHAVRVASAAVTTDQGNQWLFGADADAPPAATLAERAQR